MAHWTDRIDMEESFRRLCLSHWPKLAREGLTLRFYCCPYGLNFQFLKKRIFRDEGEKGVCHFSEFLVHWVLRNLTELKNTLIWRYFSTVSEIEKSILSKGSGLLCRSFICKKVFEKILPFREKSYFWSKNTQIDESTVMHP